MRESAYDLFDLRGKPAHSIVKRRFRRHHRHRARASLRDLDLCDWIEGDFEIPPLFPTNTSCNGSTIFLGGQQP